MCNGRTTVNHEKKCVSTYTSEVVNGNTTEIPSYVPEHVDNPILDRNLKTGVLGFRYENKSDGMIIVYTSPEAKTFCKLMKIHPLKQVK